MEPKTKDILIVGLGNEVLKDDSIGPKLAFEMQKIFISENITIDTAALGGLELLELIRDYNHVIIIDAIKTLGGIPGSVYYLTPQNFKETSHISNLHDISFLTALDLGKKLGIKIPGKIEIIAIEIVEDMEFGEELTPILNEKYPAIVAKVTEWITEMIEGKDIIE